MPNRQEIGQSVAFFLTVVTVREHINLCLWDIKYSESLGIFRIILGIGFVGYGLFGL